MAEAKANLDHIGWTYLGIVIGWTIALVAVMTFLWRHRQLPHLQIRRLPLVFTAMILLHLYGTICFVGYVIMPIAPCGVEYWIMSILVPFGVAIFQVSNTQFLYIASQQRRFTSIQSLSELVKGKKMSALDGQTGSLWQRTIRRLKSMDQLTRMVVFIGAAMVVQVRRVYRSLLPLLIYTGRSYYCDLLVVA